MNDKLRLLEKAFPGTIIGYSAFRLFDECYEYNENACYIADSPESLKLKNLGCRSES